MSRDGGWRNRLVESLLTVLAVAVVSRIAFMLLEPLVPLLLGAAVASLCFLLLTRR